MRKNLLLLTLLLLSSTVSAAELPTVKIGELFYILNESSKTASVTYKELSAGKNYSFSSIEIPSKITCDGISYTVTTLAYGAFEYCDNLTSVKIPNSVTYLGMSAFSYCKSLTSIEIPNSVIRIGEHAFSYCESLKSVKIPDSVNAIGSYAFGNCISLTSFAVPNSVTSISNDVFYRCKALTSIEIPNTVTTIGSGAFQYCESLASVKIPNSVTSIGPAAFNGCKSLNSVVIPNTVTSIGAQTFKSCESLVSVVIPNSVTSIGDEAFSRCSSLTSVNIPGSVTSIGNDALAYCSSLANITVDKSNQHYSSVAGVLYNKDVTEIIQFPAAYNSTSFTIPGTVTHIGNRAFYESKGLTSVEIPNSVTSIEECAFYGCGITSLVIPNSVISLGDAIVGECENLKSVTIGTGVHSIGRAFGYSDIVKAFWLGKTPPENASSVYSLVNYVPNDSYSLENQIVNPYISSIFEVDGIKYVFTTPSEHTCEVVDIDYSDGKSSVTIGKTVNYNGVEFKVSGINDYSFYGNTDISSVYVSDGVEYIGNQAMSGCEKLEIFSAGVNVKSIGDGAFSECGALKTFYSFPPVPPVCGSDALTDVDKWNCTLYVPAASMEKYMAASPWKDFFFIKELENAPNNVAEFEYENAIGEVYDLYGRRVYGKPLPGIYVINGRKTVIR